jgi:integrase
MPLTDRFIQNLKANTKQHKHFDGGGLYVHVSPAGGKLWRLSYRYNGKVKLLSFGAYPAVSLKMARDRRDEAKSLLAQGIDPGERKKELKMLSAAHAENTFEAVAKEWHAKTKDMWKKKRAEVVLARLTKNVFPFVGKMPIATIKAPDLLSIARRMEERGAVYCAHSVMGICGRVFRYGIAVGKAEHDITADLRGALTPHKKKHYATITDPKKVGQLLRAIDDYPGHSTVSHALKLAPLVFVRPGELRNAEWAEFDLDNAEWRIPAEKMKMGEQHLVPLSKQTLKILHSLKKITGGGKYLFPSIRSDDRPITDATVNAALRILGYTKEEITGHGFRAMASTLLNELGWNRDAIERQLAHAERNSVRAAYNFAEFLPERRKMMDAWADYLTELKENAGGAATDRKKYRPSAG